MFKLPYLKRFLSVLGMGVVSVLLMSCSGEHPLMKPASSVSKSDVVTVARLYSEMKWRGVNENAYHDIDPDGKMIHTPDLCANSPQDRGYWWMGGNAVNTGMPYKWGGWDTPNSFKDKLNDNPGKGMARYAAGDVASEAKVKQGDAAVSKYAIGIDCSGFISKCWRLDRSYSTKELAQFCSKIPMNELNVGDILLKPGVHVALFMGWADRDQTRMKICESGPRPFWGVSEHVVPVDTFVSDEYECYRYNNLKN